MIQINPAQIWWLVVNKPETEHTVEAYDGELTTFISLSENDIIYCEEGDYKYYLTPDTYNALPTEFKQLADATT
jgi:hypothetical protein